ncbi:MAG: S-layer family protein [Nostoc indistinguendum CM1-VF10]|nr:S-layer family protein [Nostoc indistinguendum CM1-VF10]
MGDSGNINITTGSLRVSGAGTRLDTPTYGGGKAGNVNIVARDTVTFDASDSTGGVAAVSSVEEGNVNGSDINITTRSLNVIRGAQLVAVTWDEGNAGNVNIVARDTVTFDGVASTGFSSSGAGTSVQEESTGNGGDINITTRSLRVMGGARVSANTRGEGKAGNVNIVARDSVTFDGVASTGFSSSGAGTSVQEESTGNGGDINITTRSLRVMGGARVSANTRGEGKAGNVNIVARDSVTFDGVASTGVTSRVTTNVTETGKGDGGDINITTGVLSLTNGGNIDAATYSQGNAGNINITARDAVSFDGVDSDGFGSGAYSSVLSGAVGQGGNITVNTDLFLITNKGELSASSEGQGNAGNLEVNARQIRLDNQGAIQAQTASGQGGNIKLQVQDLLLLRRGSKISTNAGTDLAGGNGGNITIDGKFIVAIPNEDSDISANAFSGTGGNIQINSQGIFGIESHPEPTQKSDITASSKLGVSGVININTPDNSSIQNSFTQLSPNVIDTNALIANSCIARGTKRQENSFTITGSGALRNSPGDVLMSAYTTGDVRNVESTSRTWKKGDPIIEAQGLYRLPDGQLLLSRACG